MKLDFKVSLLVAMALTVSLAAAGCGQKRDGGQLPPVQVKSSEPVSEAPVVLVTEAVTEAPETELPPQPVTEHVPETQPATEPAPVPETQPAPVEKKELTAKEERDQETRYENWVTMWASDDVNVREKPTTKKDNIFNSLEQGQAVTVVGETPNWYVVYFEEDDSTGYVSKDYISSGEVAPMTDEERAAAQSQPAETAAPVDADDNVPAPAPAPAPAASSGDGSGSTVSSDANVRSTAGETGEVIGVLNAGTPISITGEEGGWYQIDYNGTQGYVNKNLVG